MNHPDYYRTMARYNQWMNDKLYTCCAKLPDAERKANRGAFFKSIHATLNHLLHGDRVWVGRLSGRLGTLGGEAHSRLALPFFLQIGE